jgi:site-specific recombinase XerD
MWVHKGYRVKVEPKDQKEIVVTLDPQAVKALKEYLDRKETQEMPDLKAELEVVEHQVQEVVQEVKELLDQLVNKVNQAVQAVQDRKE